MTMRTCVIVLALSLATTAEAEPSAIETAFLKALPLCARYDAVLNRQSEPRSDDIATRRKLEEDLSKLAFEIRALEGGTRYLSRTSLNDQPENKDKQRCALMLVEFLL